MMALVDCNNFYASCERLFRPDLKQTPIVVLSNNDGCVVARSPEAKAMGIKMGVPVFQLRQQLTAKQWQQLQLFSSNYALYGDISARVMHCLGLLAPAIEVYSIDEAFLDLSGFVPKQGYQQWAQQLKQQIYQQVGIAVSVGIGRSKTLAKLANHAAKRYRQTAGVVCLEHTAREQRLLQLCDCADVWGVGRRIAPRLQQLAINNAWQLAQADPQFIRQQFGLPLAQTVMELNGQRCLQLETISAARQQIVCSRSFQPAITDAIALKQALAQFASQALRRCRKQQLLAKRMLIFVQGNRFSERYYAKNRSVQLVQASADTGLFLQAISQLMPQLYHAEHPIKRAGVMLLDLQDSQQQQLDCLISEPQPKRQRQQQLCQLMDQINASGMARLYFASSGHQTKTQQQQHYLSPAYTQHWQQLPVAR